MDMMANETKGTRNLATIIFASLMVAFSVLFLIARQKDATYLYREDYLYFWKAYGYGSALHKSFWVLCCYPALLVISIMLLFVVVWNKRGVVWRLMPLVTFAILVHMLGWRVSYWDDAGYFISGASWGNGFISSLNNGYMVPFLLLELALIVIQIVFVFQRRKIRALAISSTVLLSVYVITLGGYFVFHRYFYIFPQIHTEVIFIMMMGIYIIWDYMQIEPRKKQPVESKGKKAIELTYRYFCPSCGARFTDGKNFCDQCGTGLTELAQQEKVDGQTYASLDKPSTGIAILGFIVPLAGFIMWVSWNSSMPQKARSAGKGALIGAITYAVLSIVSVIMVLVLL